MQPIQKTLSNAFSLCVPTLFLVQIANATVVRNVSSDQAQGITGEAISVDVAPGVGLNISFIQTGEFVKKAWIDDPSRITLSFDGTLCQTISQGQECSSDQGATVVHLRQIRPIDFPDLPRSSTNGTLLTLITEGTEGRKLYQFRVRPVAREPKYTTIAVSPIVNRSTTMAISPEPQLAQLPEASVATAVGVEPMIKAPVPVIVAPPQMSSVKTQSSELATNQELPQFNSSQSELPDLAIPQATWRNRIVPVIISPPANQSLEALTTSAPEQSSTMQEWAQNLSSSNYFQQLQQ
ncbi:hypothetical protein [Leptolyngbya sp. NIES-2104]|uniref:hypothetical protein n=1 Tax=Leptolyngbya sp. NIES-2104 TaxID=1552121 RepID=UPI0006ECC2BA|nr:hypothetical protein [Leptolyngbya sp. NIES-2104]GAP99619.1 hypothetical protein NIES2104_61850 [Leptolyngbya sp. NIES-2104]